MIVWSRVIQVSPPYGALVVYGGYRSPGTTITVKALDEKENLGQPYYASLQEYKADDGTTVRAAVFPALPPGNYRAIEPGYSTSGKNVTVFPGAVAEVSF